MEKVRGEYRPGEIISYTEMCSVEGLSLQKGMNFRSAKRNSILLMSRRENAPYRDEIRDDGRTIIYEGHDVSNTRHTPNPKLLDQPLTLNSGRPTANGHFVHAAQCYKTGELLAERVRVYEKIRAGIWTFNGTFRLTDAWRESDGTRQVVKLRLEIDESDPMPEIDFAELDHTRVIPPDVKLEVWKRDQGRCTKCGSNDNLHFDHIIPYSRGGTSLEATNIQLLCARHNIQKSNRLE